MSFETLLLIVIFLVLPLLERLMKRLRERGDATRPGPPAEAPAPRPAPTPQPPVRPPRPVRPDARSPRPGVPQRRRPQGPPPRRPIPAPAPLATSEAASLEAAAVAVPEDQRAAATSPIAAPAITEHGPRRAARAWLDLSGPDSLRRAIVAQAVLGPCRAARPYDFGSDV